MAGSRAVSITTSFVMIALSGATLVYSSVLTRFEVASFGAQYPSREIASRFVNFIGLRATARRALAEEPKLTDASQEEIENVLAVEPSNGVFWLRLAEKRYQRTDAGRVAASLEALRMSEVVQPREAETMALRAQFVLSHWEDLPQSNRRLATADLVELAESLSDEQREQVIRIIAGKTETVRKEIEDEIVDRAHGDKALVSWLNL